MHFNTLKLSGTGIEGIGFAIPISSTTNIIDQLIEYQTVKRPYIGITGSSVDSTTAKRYNLPEGIYVESVEENSPASTAGLKQSDIITKIEGTEVTSVSELNKIKYTYNIGDTITLTIYRDGSEQDISLTLAETPEETEESSSNTNQNNNYNSNDNQQTPNNGGSSIFDLFR
jgi:serine protease Do